MLICIRVLKICSTNLYAALMNKILETGINLLEEIMTLRILILYESSLTNVE